MRIASLVLIAGCGRIGFDATGDAPPASDIVAHYTCEALTAGVLPDVSGGGHDGTCAGTACPVIDFGKHGGGCSFDGNDRVDITAFTMDQFAIALWLELAQPAPSMTVCVVNRAFDPAGTTSNSWQLCVNANGSFFFGTTDSEAMPAVPITFGAWHHVVVEYGGSQRSIFLDGALVHAGPATPITYDSSPITLGEDIDLGQPVAPITGVLDDLYIYDRTLTLDEVATLSAP